MGEYGILEIYNGSWNTILEINSTNSQLDLTPEPEDYTYSSYNLSQYNLTEIIQIAWRYNMNLETDFVMYDELKIYTTYELNLTNLTLDFEEFFQVGEYNLVKANYTIYNTSLPITNATCEFESDEGNGLMTYNNSSQYYEIYVIPETIGIVNFNVICNTTGVETQIETQTYTSSLFAGNPYNISIRMFTELNASEENAYVDDFSHIILKAENYNCSIINEDETSDCYIIAEYENGEALFEEMIAIGNFTLYYYSGSIIAGEDYEQPTYETFNALKYLGNFEFNENRTQLWLYIDVAEINFILALQRFALTYGLLIVGIIIAFAVGMLFFWFSGKNFAVGLFSMIATLYLLMLMGVIPNITEIVGLIIS